MSYKNNNIPRHVLGNSNILPQSHANQSVFNLSEDLKTTISFDYLYPILWEELNPGDKFEVSTKTLGRLMPMVAPTMSNIKLKYYAFFVPNRLLWENWTKFMGEKIYGDEVLELSVPQTLPISINRPAGDLADHMGVPTDNKQTGQVTVSALPFRAYRKIWNEWFRANEIQAKWTEEFGNDSIDTYLTSGLYKKGKPLDYFTSCLPYPQAGEPVVIPVAGETPVRTYAEQTRINALRDDGVTVVTGDTQIATDSDHVYLKHDTITEATKGNTTGLYTDMANVTGISIEMLRKASALQVLLEKDARAGETYIELMNAHYATSVPDFLVGRSQYLGSTTTMINVEPIAQTGGTSDISPQGNLSGVGIGVNGDKLCEISAVEHGVFMVLACLDGELSYSQGLPRKFSKESRYDYMFPEFHNLGDQAVLNKEIFLTGQPDDNLVFGYQERYRELRESTNKVSGLMRPNVEGSLDIWHLGQTFENRPTLSDEFIKSNTPIKRVMSVTTEDQLMLNVYFDIKATRTLPVTSNPSILAGRV